MMAILNNNCSYLNWAQKMQETTQHWYQADNEVYIGGF